MVQSGFMVWVGTSYPMKVKSRAVGSSGCGWPVKRCTPTPKPSSGSDSHCSSKPACSSRRQIHGTWSGELRCRVQIRVAPWAQNWAVREGVLDVLVGDVAEYAAGQHDVRGNHSVVVVSHRGVAHHNVDPAQAGGLGGPLGHCCVVRVEFDQACGDVLASGMTLHHSEQVVSLPGAQADSQPTRWSLVQGPADLLLNTPQSLAERRIGQSIIVVPGLPVHGKHSTSTRDGMPSNFLFTLEARDPSEGDAKPQTVSLPGAVSRATGGHIVEKAI